VSEQVRMREALKRLEQEARAELQAVRGESQVRAVRTKYLGRKGLLTQWLREMGKLPADERPALGSLANQLKTALDTAVDQTLEKIRQQQRRDQLLHETVDITLPGRRPLRGGKHLITQVTEEIVSIFERLGFEVSEGPEVELDYYNFEALNFPKDHPARDMQDTFYFTPNVVLRTHTSPVQVRTMESRKPPLRVIAPGKVYRHDSDPTHSPMFHQVEGFIVDHRVTFADLKGTLTYFIHQFLGTMCRCVFDQASFPLRNPAPKSIFSASCAGEAAVPCARKAAGWRFWARA